MNAAAELPPTRSIPAVIRYDHREAGVPLVRAGGLSLVRRCVEALARAGFARLDVIVQPDDVSAVRAELAQLSRPVSVSVHTELPAALPAEQVSIALGDRVWHPSLLTALARPLAAGDSARVLAVPASCGDRPAPGLARVAGSLVGSIGRGEDELSAPALERAAPGEVRVVTVEPRYQRVAGEGERWAAESLLLRWLVKPTDGVVSRTINRRISAAITRRLAPFSVKPNHVTCVVLLLGLASAPLALLGTYWGFALGALCYYISAVLDGVDGELSRLKYLGTPFGAWFDTVTDDVVGLAYLVGAFGGLSRATGAPIWLWVGILSFSCYVATIVPRYYLFITRVGAGDHQQLAPPGAERTSGWLGRAGQLVKETVFRTDFIPFYAAVTALAGAVGVYAISYALGSIAALADTAITFRRAVRTPRLRPSV